MKETTKVRLQKVEVMLEGRKKAVREEEVNVDDAQLERVTIETSVLWPKLIHDNFLYLLHNFHPIAGGDGASHAGEPGSDGARHDTSDEDCNGVLVSHRAELVCVTYSFFEEIIRRRQAGMYLRITFNAYMLYSCIPESL